MRRALFVTAAFVALAIVPGAAYMRFGLAINGTNTVLRWPGAIPYRVSDAELADGISAAGARQIGYAVTRLTAVGLAAGDPDVLARVRSSVFRLAI